ncbi:hypothetical protein [Prosthecobacter sp.]|uniref:hypothetical protein n=1 Tax=Prosthecobacter sp. TaxID=1965333 RepID=UPI0037844781
MKTKLISALTRMLLRSRAVLTLCFAVAGLHTASAQIDLNGTWVDNQGHPITVTQNGAQMFAVDSRGISGSGIIDAAGNLNYVLTNWRPGTRFAGVIVSANEIQFAYEGRSIGGWKRANAPVNLVNLAGAWRCANGLICMVTQNGSNLYFDFGNGGGAQSGGVFLNGSTIKATYWEETASISPDGRTLTWSQGFNGGAVWRR